MSANAGYLSTEDFAAKAGVNVRNLYNWIKAGKIAAVRNEFSRQYMIPESELAKFKQVERPIRQTAIVEDAQVRADLLPPAPATPPPPAIVVHTEPSAAVRDAILAGIADTHGAGVLAPIIAAWDGRVQETVKFILGLPGTLSLLRARAIAATIPAEAIAAAPITWVPGIVTMSMDMTGPYPAEKALGPIPEPLNQYVPPEPEARDRVAPERRVATKPKRAGKRKTGPTPNVCDVCGQPGGSHGSGCPNSRVAESEGGATGARIPSPRAEAAQAKAYAERVHQLATGAPPMAGWHQCETNGQGCPLPHRWIQTSFSEEKLIGHLDSDLERLKTMNSLGAPPAQAPGPEEAPRPRPKRRARRKAK